MVRTGNVNPYFRSIHCTTAARVHNANGSSNNYLGQGLADITPRIARADAGRTS